MQNVAQGAMCTVVAETADTATALDAADALTTGAGDAMDTSDARRAPRGGGRIEPGRGSCPSARGRIGEPERERVGAEIEHDVPEAIGAV